MTLSSLQWFQRMDSSQNKDACCQVQYQQSSLYFKYAKIEQTLQENKGTVGIVQFNYICYICTLKWLILHWHYKPYLELDTFLKLGINTLSSEFLVLKIELKPQKLSVRKLAEPVTRLYQLGQAFFFIINPFSTKVIWCQNPLRYIN